MGILSCFTSRYPSRNYAYIDLYDEFKGEIRVKYYAVRGGNCSIYIDGERVFSTYQKTISHYFLNEKFVDEKIMWLPVGKRGKLRFVVDDNELTILVNHKENSRIIEISSLIELLTQNGESNNKTIYDKCWLLMDREIYADDSAEHLYRYIMKNHPQCPAYFVLSSKSKDWARLCKEGFRLLDFGSKEHEDALRACSKIISSQADRIHTDYFGDKTLRYKQFIFLQHGVIKDDLSKWLNTKHRIDLFVTTTKAEYESIVNGKYKYTKKEVKFLGLPRYDTLLTSNSPEKIILVMPTWRSYIVGESLNGGVERRFNSGFYDTEYALGWMSFLKNKDFLDLLSGSGYRCLLMPHPNIRQYIKGMNLSLDIEIVDESVSYQTLFKQGALLVTDYSSVAFDFAYLNKPVVYYQFDEETFFSGVHTYNKGYYDYRRDGFGPVFRCDEDVIEFIKNSIEFDCLIDEKYKERIDKTFIYRDGRNCERVYNAICDLDKP